MNRSIRLDIFQHFNRLMMQSTGPQIIRQQQNSVSRRQPNIDGASAPALIVINTISTQPRPTQRQALQQENASPTTSGAHPIPIKHFDRMSNRKN